MHSFIRCTVLVTLLIQWIIAPFGTNPAVAATTKLGAFRFVPAAQSFGGSAYDELRSAQILSDGSAIVVGYTDSLDGQLSGVRKEGTMEYDRDALLVKYNKNGSIAWKKTFGTTMSDWFEAIQLTTNGSNVDGFIVVGSSEKMNTDDLVETDAWIAKFNLSGTMLWDKKFGGTSNDSFSAIQPTADLGFVAVGVTSSKDGDLRGYKRSTADENEDGLIVKYKSNGEIQWRRTFGGSEFEQFNAVGIMKSDNSIVVAGETQSTDLDLLNIRQSKSITNSDALLVRYAADGKSIISKRTFGGSGRDAFMGMQVAPSGEVMVAGSTNSTNLNLKDLRRSTLPSQMDGLIVNYSASLSLDWAKTYGGEDFDEFYRLQVNPDDSLYAVGYTKSTTLDLSGIRSNESGPDDQDAFLIKVNRSGTLLLKHAYSGNDTDYFNSIDTHTDGSLLAIGQASDEDGVYIRYTPVVPVTKVDITKPSITIEDGDSYQLAATVTPTNATYDSIEWSSNKPSVAAVDENGKVTAKAKGTAIITAYNPDSKLSDTVEVNVIVSVTGVTLDKSSVSLRPGNSSTIVATVAPTNASNKAITWTSSNPSFVTVTPLNATSATLKAVASGTATVTVKTADGAYTDTVAVTVITPVTGIALNKTTMELKQGASSTITPTVEPAGATDKDVEWTSSNGGVARVTDGVVTAVGPGTATIFAKTKDGGFTKTVTVSVFNPLHVFGGNATDDIVDTVATSDGGSVYVGYSSSTDGDLTGERTNGLTNNFDAVIVRLNRLQEKVWVTAFGTSSKAEQFNGVTSTDDGGFVAVGTQGQDAIINKYTSDGVLDWSRTFGGTGIDVFTSVSVAPDGSFYVVGYTSSKDGQLDGKRRDTSATNTTYHDALIVHYTKSGVLDFTKTYGGSRNDFFKSLVVNSNNELVVVGYSTSKDMDFKNDRINFNNASSSAEDGFIMKIVRTNATATHSMTLIGGTGEDFVYDLDKRSDGSYVVVGVTNSMDGTFIWERPGGSTYHDDAYIQIFTTDLVPFTKAFFGGSMADQFTAVKVLDDQSIIAVGNTNSNDKQLLNKRRDPYGISYDALYVKFNNTLTSSSVSTFGGTGSDIFKSVIQTSTKAIVTVGTTESQDVDLSQYDSRYIDGFIRRY